MVLHPPSFAQVGNGSTMTVVSRAWGRGAKAGALVELYYPHYSDDNLWDSYVGVRWRGQKLRWAHDLDLAGQRLTNDTGLVTSELGDRSVALTIEDLVRPKNDAHVRRVIVTSRSRRSPIASRSRRIVASRSIRSVTSVTPAWQGRATISPRAVRPVLRPQA